MQCLFVWAEMLEVGPRGGGMAWGSLSNWAGNFLVGMCFPSARAAIGAYCFLVFAAVTFALFLFQRYLLPFSITCFLSYSYWFSYYLRISNKYGSVTALKQ
jgi:hypothetical protein